MAYNLRQLTGCSGQWTKQQMLAWDSDVLNVLLGSVNDSQGSDSAMKTALNFGVGMFVTSRMDPIC